MTLTDQPRTTAANQARRAAADRAVQRVTNTVEQLKRERTKVSFAEVARRADVSRTFLYQNDEARSAVEAATSAAGSRPPGAEAARVEATWRERALNAEHELRRAHDEIVQQRGRLGDLLGQIRDLEADLPPDGVQRLLSENHTLKARCRQVDQQARRLDERLAAARDNNRFLDKRIADLEAELDFHRPARPTGTPPAASAAGAEPPPGP